MKNAILSFISLTIIIHSMYAGAEKTITSSEKKHHAVELNNATISHIKSTELNTKKSIKNNTPKNKKSLHQASKNYPVPILTNCNPPKHCPP